ncbi:hypothetical protein J8V57_04810 [Xenorhabdus sp. PB61.4]|uniref:hypothetical protein n=1 Tax=Xenorhabdus TaxID=626 RepID=UPI001E42EF2C|nr:hypothetical protein [Xenorhabdus sp. PB61.4]MCC8365604.1 hypothetical protein [Xenorhabdus sp. PB61.4]
MKKYLLLCLVAGVTLSASMQTYAACAYIHDAKGRKICEESCKIFADPFRGICVGHHQ